MKKNSILLIMFISLFFIFDKNVFATGSCTCVYGTDNISFKIEVSDSGTPKVSVEGKLSSAAVLGTNNFAAVNFKDTTAKKWKCPNSIFYTVLNSGHSVKYGNLSVVKPSSGSYSSSSLDVTKSSDGEYYEDVSGDSNDGTIDAVHCVYGNLTLTIDNSNKTVNGSNAGCSTISIPGYDSLSDKTKCPDYVYGIKAAVPGTSGFTCRYSWTYSDGFTKINYNADEPIYDANDANDLNSTVTVAATADEYYTGCPLGVNVTKDIYGLLKILKIVVPIMVIGLTILEGVRAVAKGEIVGEEKKLAIRFVKRLIIAVILFFLPVLVNQIMIMANIWDENGTCDFSKTSEIIDDSNISGSGGSHTSPSGADHGGGGSHTSPSGAEHGGGGHRR